MHQRMRSFLHLVVGSSSRNQGARVLVSHDCSDEMQGGSASLKQEAESMCIRAFLGGLAPKEGKGAWWPFVGVKLLL